MCTIVYYALTYIYRSIHGDCLVSRRYVVQHGNSTQWPEQYWGLKLGEMIERVRNKGTFINDYPERRQMLDELGFVWDVPGDEMKKFR